MGGSRLLARRRSAGSGSPDDRVVPDPTAAPAADVPAVDDVVMLYLRVDGAGGVRWANERALLLWRNAGAPRATRANLADLAHEHERDVVRTALTKAVADGRAEVVVGLAGPCDGDARPFLHLVLSRDGDGPRREIVAQGWDVSALVLRLRDLEDHAVHDPVTGLANRTAFLERLHREIARSSRSGMEIAVLVADVDALRAVSDTYGRGAADTVLAEFGRRLTASLRPGDTLARIGDDEFAVICPDLAGPQQAMTVADRLRATALEPLTVAGREQFMTLSVGVAFAPGDAHDQAASLLRRAGRAVNGRGPRHSAPRTVPT
jgi:diguanylate cyclase (GGDEF)-like protein